MEELVVWLIRIAKFAVLLGILIFVHELGHFLLARRFGVYIKKFFLGFDIGGLKIFSFQGKETEYGIGILPLGGYVKMAGQEDLPPGDDEAREQLEEEDRDIPPERRFDRKPLHQRAAIVFAGPLMNLILGLVVFILIAMIGIQVPLDEDGPLVGEVEPGLPASAAGLQPGDRIAAIAGERIKDWRELNWKMMVSDPGTELAITVERDGEKREVQVTPEKFRGASYPRIGISSGGKVSIWNIQTDSPAFQAGLRVKDIITSINGTPVFSPGYIHPFDDLLSGYEKSTAIVDIYRPETEESLALEIPIYRENHIPGLLLDGNQVASVNQRASTAVQELKKGDRVVAIDGETMPPEQIAEKIQSVPPGSEIGLTIKRPGWMFFKPAARFLVRAKVSPVSSIEGINPVITGETKRIRYSGLKAVTVGAGMALDSIKQMFGVFYMMIVGKIETSEVAGPVMIFQITSQVHGLADLLVLLALISINLGIINLFPFPVLDGGHLLFLSLESIIRRPLSPRFLSIAQQLGLAMIAVLFLLITYNDILRVLGYR